MSSANSSAHLAEIAIRSIASGQTCTVYAGGAGFHLTEAKDASSGEARIIGGVTVNGQTVFIDSAAISAVVIHEPVYDGPMPMVM